MPQVNEESLQAIFCAVLNLRDFPEADKARQIEIPAWDSLAHVSLIAAIESEFGIVIDLADQIDLISYEAVLAYFSEPSR